MDDLWQQFHRLPKAIRDAVSRPEALQAVDSLEQRYPSLDLASFIMRAVVKEFPITDLENQLQSEFGLKEAETVAVATELRQTVFSGVADYLGLVASPTKTPSKPTVPANLPVNVSPVAPIPQPISAPASPVGPVAPTQAYSDDDAAEIAQQAKKLQAMTTPSEAAGLDDIAQSIIAQHHLAFHDELLAKRAVAILKARLKDIRNTEETLMMLVRGPKVGGLGLDQDIAKGVVDALERQVAVVKERGLVRPPDVIVPPPPPARPPLSAQRPVAKPPLFRDAASASVRPSLPPLPTVPPAPATVAPAKPSPTIKRPVDIPSPPPLQHHLPPTPSPVKSAPSIVKRERLIDRPAIADITRPMKMLGPAEEMRTMTLIEFRRLGQGANESTNRLLEKFKQLQHESFTIWAEAVNGWRQSEVYQLYLAMGRQSMEQAMGITEVIKQRSAANQLYLSEHEFTALADMNRALQS